MPGGTQRGGRLCCGPALALNARAASALLRIRCRSVSHPGLDEPLERCVDRLILHGEARCKASGQPWRFRLVAFGDGEPQREGGPFTVIPLRHVALFLLRSMVSNRQMWRDVQFGDPVLDLLHLLDKLGLLGEDGGGVELKAAPAEVAEA